MDTEIKDERLAEVEQELDALGYCAANSTAEALALYTIACELRLIRRSLESVISFDGCIWTEDSN